MRTAVCVICFKPHDAWIKFLSTFTEYDVFVIIDDNSHDYVSSNDKIKFVQVSHEDCMNNGFLGINFLFHNPTGWEKALYYFSTVMKDHDRVWFMEEDIFFNSEKTLLDIDAAYPTSDLLTAPCEENKDGNFTYLKNQIALPPSVIKWAGMKSDNGKHPTDITTSSEDYLSCYQMGCHSSD